jgi:outer membrane lipopolysaccharide assembly protein LptE/RlpB
LIFLAAFTLLLAGCGVSLKNTSQAQPSTYNVTVTASGTSAPTHTQQFVLTVTE